MFDEKIIILSSDLHINVMVKKMEGNVGSNLNATGSFNKLN